MAPTTLQSIITSSGTGSGDLAPLAANTTFSNSVNAELAARDAVVLATEARAARTEDLVAGVALFAGAMRSIRAVAKRFPETSKFMDEAAKQVQGAMGAAAYNPQPLPGDTRVVATTPLPPKPVTPAPTPLPASVPVTQPKPAPLPPTTVTGQPPVAAPPFRPPTTPVTPVK